MKNNSDIENLFRLLHYRSYMRMFMCIVQRDIKRYRSHKVTNTLPHALKNKQKKVLDTDLLLLERSLEALLNHVKFVRKNVY